MLATTAGAQQRIPTGELPQPGMCRVWLNGVPADRQPRATDCATARRNQPANARILYGGDSQGRVYNDPRYPGNNNGVNDPRYPGNSGAIDPRYPTSRSGTYDPRYPNAGTNRGTYDPRSDRRDDRNLSREELRRRQDWESANREREKELSKAQHEREKEWKKANKNDDRRDHDHDHDHDRDHDHDHDRR
jgi:hypothetical protein